MDTQYNYAFLSNNIITSLVVFNEHNETLLQQVAEQVGADDFKSCSEFGEFAEVGGDFYNGKLYPAKPADHWVRDENLGIWVDTM